MSVSLSKINAIRKYWNIKTLQHLAIQVNGIIDEYFIKKVRNLSIYIHKFM